jgi:hemerythrin
MAALIGWTPECSLNLKEIDDQHQELVRLINELHQGMMERKSQQILGDIINGLIAYTKTHFLTEEKYFIEFGYNEAVIHKKEHRDFVSKVSDFKKDFDRGKMMLSMEIMNFLKDWLVKHIQGSDKKYVPMFQANGIV